MEVININDLDIDQNSNALLRTIFSEDGVKGNITVGNCVVPPGARIPVTGLSNHTQNEYSIVTKGSVVTETLGKVYRVEAGQATFIPAGQEHFCYNDSDEECEIVWVLIG